MDKINLLSYKDFNKLPLSQKELLGRVWLRYLVADKNKLVDSQLHNIINYVSSTKVDDNIYQVFKSAIHKQFVNNSPALKVHYSREEKTQPIENTLNIYGLYTYNEYLSQIYIYLQKLQEKIIDNPQAFSWQKVFVDDERSELLHSKKCGILSRIIDKAMLDRTEGKYSMAQNKTCIYGFDMCNANMIGLCETSVPHKKPDPIDKLLSTDNVRVAFNTSAFRAVVGYVKEYMSTQISLSKLMYDNKVTHLDEWQDTSYKTGNNIVTPYTSKLSNNLIVQPNDVLISIKPTDFSKYNIYRDNNIKSQKVAFGFYSQTNYHIDTTHPTKEKEKE